jgi:molybdopterin synthase sulfur carrier subunit
MKLNIRLFASLKELIGGSQVSLELKDPCTVSDLLSELFQIYPSVQSFSKAILVSINQEYADPSQPIAPQDEIALFPPVSGG